MLKQRKSIFSILLMLVLIFSISSSVFAASTYGPFYVRPDGIGQGDSFRVELNSGVTQFQLSNYKVYGVHAGQQASIRWTIEDVTDGTHYYTFDKGDVTDYKTYTFTGLQAGHTYQVGWESLNDYEVQGGTYVTVDGNVYQ